jgi:hypothetical protein
MSGALPRVPAPIRFDLESCDRADEGAVEDGATS